MKIKVPEIYLPFSLLEIFRISLVKTGIAVHFQPVTNQESMRFVFRPRGKGR